MAQFRNFSRPATGQKEREARYGWTMALLATAGFSVAPPLTRAAILDGMNPTTLLAVRMVITALLLSGTILLLAPGRFVMDRRGWLVCGIAGLSNGVGMITFFWALTRIEASVASMIFSLSPLVVLGLLAFRGERFTRRHLLRLGLGVGGAYLLIGSFGASRSGVDWLGVVLVLVTIFTFAVHLVLIQWFLQGYDAYAVTLVVIVGMALVAVAFWLFQGAEWHEPGRFGWLAIIVLALVSTHLARLALFAGVRHLGSGQIALLTPLETLLTVLWSILFLQERLTLEQWAGGTFILASALLAVRRLSRARRRPRWRIWWRP